MNVKKVKMEFPLKLSLPFSGVEDAAIKIFVKRFKNAPLIKLESTDYSSAEKMINLEIESEDGIQEMIKIIETPVDESEYE